MIKAMVKSWRGNIRPAVLFLIVFIFIVCPIFSSRAFASEGVKVGGIVDNSGPTSDAGRYAYMAMQDYFVYLNAKGGINGNKVSFFIFDDQYNVALSIAHYQKLREFDVCGILGWGTATAQALAPHVTKDEIPFLPASLSESLVNPVKPYVFSIASSYEDQFITLLRYANKNPKQEGRPVRVAFVYNSTPFGTSPIAAAERVAKELGMELVGKEIVELTDTQADAQMRRLLEANPDYVIIQETATATTAVLKSAKKTGLNATMMATFYGGDEKILIDAGDAARDYIMISPFSRWYEENISGIDDIKAFLKKQRPEMTEISMYYIEGWIMASVMAEAIKNAGPEVNGKTVKKSLESLSEFDTKGLSYKVSYGPDNHKGIRRCKLFRADINAKRFYPITDWLE